MTIHTSHPFATPDDPLRRLRGRLGGAVTLWTAGAGRDRAGLTVTSVMLAHGEPARLLALLDPDADLTDALVETGRGVVHTLSAQHRDLADAFAGVAPAPGGPFRLAAFEDAAGYGPRLADAAAWAEVRVESTAEVGWSLLATVVVEAAHVAEAHADDPPLLHHRGRYRRLEER
ncbi:hypothetical protein GCM10023340_30090 [Nocardioides marinquilinus]|uniref:Flavin reductase like domain-containing protein n=1 Tax=Nocardioides marinquilinus TaxID=1210400 RepID=A0ABP9PTW2_9ACTN